jgi:hypothetical protein
VYLYVYISSVFVRPTHARTHASTHTHVCMCLSVYTTLAHPHPHPHPHTKPNKEILLTHTWLCERGDVSHQERERSLLTINRGLKVGKYNALSGNTAAYDGEYNTPTLRLALWHAFRLHTRGPRPSSGPPQSPIRSLEVSGSPNRSPDLLRPWILILSRSSEYWTVFKKFASQSQRNI